MAEGVTEVIEAGQAALRQRVRVGLDEGIFKSSDCHFAVQLDHILYQ